MNYMTFSQKISLRRHEPIIIISSCGMVTQPQLLKMTQWKPSLHLTPCQTVWEMAAKVGVHLFHSVWGLDILREGGGEDKCVPYQLVERNKALKPPRGVNFPPQKECFFFFFIVTCDEKWVLMTSVDDQLNWWVPMKHPSGWQNQVTVCKAKSNLALHHYGLYHNDVIHSLFPLAT